MVILRKFKVKIKCLAGLVANHALFKAGDKLTATQLQGKILGRTTVKRHAVFLANKVNDRFVTFSSCALNLALVDKILLHPLNDFIDIFGFNLDSLDLGLEFFVIA